MLTMTARKGVEYDVCENARSDAVGLAGQPSVQFRQSSCWDGPSRNTFQISKEAAPMVYFQVNKTERDQGATSWDIDYANLT